MRRALINEDSNQFGPGTDLIICLLALLMILVVIISHLYSTEKNSRNDDRLKVEESAAQIKKLEEENESFRKQVGELKIKGSFEHGGEFLVAGTFEQNPYYQLRDPATTESEVYRIVQKYKSLSDQFPIIFIIGHANKLGIEGKPDLSDEERQKYNWEFASVRSAVIANLVQKYLSEEEKNNIFIVSTGEFDLKIPENPDAAENAFVEVFFGNEWKPQSYKKGSR